MKALVLNGHGYDLTEAARPVPTADQVLVQVKACGLNRADLGVIAGGMHGSQGGAGTIPGLEWAGDVVEVGANVKGFKVGDRVMCSGSGAYAQYAVSDWGRTMHIPSASMTYEQAVTLPIAIQTMHNALITVGEMRPGETVLIQGASSGVGLMAMQIAKALGAKKVIGTSSNPERRAQLKQYGADVALDNSDPDWPKQAIEANGGVGVDLIIDQLSGAMANQNLEACKVLGRIVNVGRLAGRFAEFDFDLHAMKRIKYTGVTFRTRSVEEVREIVRLADAALKDSLKSGSLSLPIDSVYTFDKIGDAFARMKANQHFGKIVVTMN
ncbi:zinc-binding dehydrogenase [Orrella sp. NBD-18]|uniref:Zinc-binding dehydrogenase n=1 Tax=Sheuella amnicola TaxID=2707330 RepID=A0A6B2QVK0_9BURK|nr:zinc-binding dehydrogenase [Sheuella amnicola]NDY82181.1 zinc-binding dehydrogenase [Sheuella amnicola]HBI83560.1 quinone oxidoreductase [Alcaligenaceae bacterium]